MHLLHTIWDDLFSWKIWFCVTSIIRSILNEKSECHKSKVQGQSANKWETEINWNLVCLILKVHTHNFNNVFSTQCWGIQENLGWCLIVSLQE